MRKRLVLVDSSFWIRFFRSHTPDSNSTLLQSLLREKRVATNWLIRLELLSGTESEESYQALDRDLAALRHLALNESLFQTASILRWRLARRGLTVPVVDSIIAACAIHYDCSLLQADRHFPLMARHVPLRLQPKQPARPVS